MSLGKPEINDAYVLSWISLLITIIAFVAGLVVALVSSSAATLGYSLENLVDSLSSILVLWRFWGGGRSVSVERLAQREKRASVAIALTFLVLAVAVVSVASTHLRHEEKTEDPGLLLAISIPSVVVFGLLAVLKFWIGHVSNLDSPALRKDGLCSLAGSALSVAVLVGAALQYSGNGIWWFDGACAVGISMGLFFAGARTLVNNALHGNSFWELSFWQTVPELGLDMGKGSGRGLAQQSDLDRRDVA